MKINVQLGVKIGVLLTDRHKGGVSPAQALVRNVGTYRLDAKGELQVVDP